MYTSIYKTIIIEKNFNSLMSASLSLSKTVEAHIDKEDEDFVLKQSTCVYTYELTQKKIKEIFKKLGCNPHDKYSIENGAKMTTYFSALRESGDPDINHELRACFIYIGEFYKQQEQLIEMLPAEYNSKIQMKHLRRKEALRHKELYQKFLRRTDHVVAKKRKTKFISI